jgi:uncharacterized protein YbaR (Trm112 family)
MQVPNFALPAASCPSRLRSATVPKEPKKVIRMALSQDLLEMLVCPICKEHVQALADQSGLKCPVCRRVYPVRDDIPVMLPEEASIASE